MNQGDMNGILNDIKQVFGETIEINADKFFPIVRCDAEQLLELMRTLKEQFGFNYLANLNGVDYGEQFEMIYHLYTIPARAKLLVKTRVSRDVPILPSLIELWPTADWQEREVYDLMGILFQGHPNLLRVLLPDDFIGHPLRKDFK
ncbi:MAG: NADH-quinone oxidoreductase subunit C [Syntrophomonadaceae bacterium]|nr:NADH-quinone oxidoreductase subunit C [Syntrophomonadaceae bacterium]